MFETNVVSKPASDQPEATTVVVTSSTAAAVVTSQSADHVAPVAAFSSTMTSSSHHQRSADQNRSQYRRHNLHKSQFHAFVTSSSIINRL